ncbi:MAG: hypothetical protein K5656_03460 [Lachnospiraceae bacterium]|nr:hypothetical protein [Lachnospiraceae bacterium]
MLTLQQLNEESRKKTDALAASYTISAKEEKSDDYIAFSKEYEKLGWDLKNEAEKKAVYAFYILGQLDEVYIRGLSSSKVNNYISKSKAIDSLLDEKEQNINAEEKKRHTAAFSYLSEYNKILKAAAKEEIKINKANEKKFNYDILVNDDEVKYIDPFEGYKYEPDILPEVPKSKEEQLIEPVALYDRLVASKKIILSELKSYRAQLMLTQKDPNANFSDDKQDEKTQIKTEGSTEYKLMTASLDKAIKTLSNDDKSFANIIQVLEDLHNSAYDYHEAKNRFLIPRSESGKMRVNVASSVIFSLYHLSTDFEGIMIRLQDVHDKDRNPDIEGKRKLTNKNSFNDIKKVNEEYINNSKDKLDLDAINEAAVKKAANMRVSIERDAVLSKLNNIEGINTNSPEEYSPYEDSNSLSKAAKNYLVKSYIDKIHRKDVSFEEVHDVLDDLTISDFNNKNKMLANNPLFKRVYTKNRDSWYEKWFELEARTDKIIEKNNDYLNKCFDTAFNYNYGDYVLMQDDKAQAFAEVIVATLLTDPANKMLAFGIAYDQNKADSILKYTKNYVSHNYDFENANIKEQINNSLDDSKFKANILKDIAIKEKATDKLKQDKSKDNLKNKANENAAPKF